MSEHDIDFDGIDPAAALTEAVENDPFRRFRYHFDQVRGQGKENAACLATVDGNGAPSARMILIKSLSYRGFVFFTHYDSRKGRDIAANPFAALVMYWPSIGVQVRVEGKVEIVAKHQSESYFQSRPRESQIGAWASEQSQVIPSRESLLEKLQQTRLRFADQTSLPLPERWGGMCLVPNAFEFWYCAAARLHDRFQYHIAVPGKPPVWEIQRLSP